MPMYWTIDSKERWFIAAGEGEVTFGDMMAMLDALAGARGLSYRKLFDGRAAQFTMTCDELLAACAKVRSFHSQGPIGALAMVITDEQSTLLSRLLGALAAADRLMKVFTDLNKARSWLNRQRT